MGTSLRTWKCGRKKLLSTIMLAHPVIFPKLLRQLVCCLQTTYLSFSHSQESICPLDALVLLIACASHVAQTSIWMCGMKKINAYYIKYVIKVSCSYSRTFSSKLVKHKDLEKLLCSGTWHWRLGCQKIPAEREVSRQQWFCAMLSTTTVLPIMIIFTGAIHFCELDREDCLFAQHAVHSLPLTRLCQLCKSSFYFLQQLQGKVLLRSGISEEPCGDQGSPMLLER